MSHQHPNEIEKEFIENKRREMHFDELSNDRLKALIKEHSHIVSTGGSAEIKQLARLAVQEEGTKLKREREWTKLITQKHEEAFDEFLNPPRTIHPITSEKIENLVHGYRESIVLEEMTALRNQQARERRIKKDLPVKKIVTKKNTGKFSLSTQSRIDCTATQYRFAWGGQRMANVSIC